MISRLNHVMLYAKSLDAAVKWYQATLGFTVDYHAPGEYASLQHPAMGRLALHQDGAEGKNVGRGAMPYYLVKDLKAACAWLAGKGVEVNAVQQEADSPRHTWFWDGEGNALGIEQE